MEIQLPCTVTRERSFDPLLEGHVKSRNCAAKQGACEIGWVQIESMEKELEGTA